MGQASLTIGPGAWIRRFVYWALIGLGALGFGLLFAVSPVAAVAVWAGLLLAWQAARRLEWVALSLFFFIPMGRLTWLNSTGSIDITKLVVMALATAWAIRCLLRRDRGLITIWTESPVSVFILLFLIIYGVSLLNAYSPLKSIMSLFRLFSLFVTYLLIVFFLRTPRQVKLAIGLLLFTGFIICLLGLWESTTHQYLWYLRGQERPVTPGMEGIISGRGSGEETVTRVITVFVDYNYMGGYMAVLLGIIGGCFLAFRNLPGRLALIGLALLVLYNAILTGSRGGIAAIAVASATLLLFSRIRLKWFMLATLLIIALATFPILQQIAPQFTRGGITLKELAGARWGFWNMAWHMGLDHPLLGVGADNFSSLYPFYRVSPAPMGRWYPHSIFFQLWAEGGIPGLLALLALLSAVGVAYLTALREAQNESWRSLIVGLFAAFLGYAVFAATCNCLHDQAWWLLMALSAAVLQAGRQAKAQEAAAAPGVYGREAFVGAAFERGTV